MRLLYLTAERRSLGTEYFRGRKLFDSLRQHCESDPLLAYTVWADAWTESGDGYHDRWADQVVSEQAFRAFNPSLIVIEGGMFEHGTGRWRVPSDLLRQTVSRGGVVIAADNGRRIFDDPACWDAIHSPEARGLTGVTARRDSLHEEVLGGRLQYLGDPDNTGAYGVLICRPERMILRDDWVMATYEGVDRLAVSGAVAVSPHGVWLATGNEGATGALLKDHWVDRTAHLPWASAWQIDAGFMVFISGDVTNDGLLEQGDNDVWLTNIATNLLDRVDREQQARAPLGRLNEALRAGQQIATYLDDDAAGEVYARVADAEAEHEIRRGMRRTDEIPAAEHALRDLLDVHLDALGDKARGSLLVGELSRIHLEGLTQADTSLEYAGPTHMYSRALEIELHERVFAPFKESGRTALPEAVTDGRASKSVRHLETFLRTGTPLTLGTMAQILINVGYKLTDSEPNDFAAFLRDRLDTDAAAFCASWPRQVSSYVDKYRNRAAHTGSLSREDCGAARAFLLGEPTRLLAALIAAAPASDTPQRR